MTPQNGENPPNGVPLDSLDEPDDVPDDDTALNGPDSETSEPQGQGNRRPRNRNRRRRKSSSSHGSAPPQTRTHIKEKVTSAGGPLDSLDEIEEADDDVVVGKGSGEDTVAGAKEGGGGRKGMGRQKGKKEKDEKGNVRLKIELNLDLELQLTAKIKGDVVIGLLS